MPKKGPKFPPTPPSAPKPRPSPPRRQPRQQQRARNRRRLKQRGGSRRWQWAVVVGVVIVAGVIGVALQASRSKTENTKVVTPTAAMGPNGSVIEGQPNAKVLMEEYGDFQCPVCKLFHDQMNTTIQQLVSTGAIRFAFHPLNVIDSHSPGSTESLRAASASLSANDAGQFWNYYNLLYNNQHGENTGFLTDDQLVKFGQEAGITGSAFTTFEPCVKNHTYEGYVLKYVNKATQPPTNVNSTPTIFLNGKQIQLTSLVNTAGTALDPQKLIAAVQQAANST